MDIYSARELQKVLFQSSDYSFKRMGIVFDNTDTKIAYYVIHHITSDDSTYMAESDIQRMLVASMSGVIIKLEYISDERKKKDRLVDPVGLYIVELIEID